jgi:hypothetical protein
MADGWLSSEFQNSYTCQVPEPYGDVVFATQKQCLLMHVSVPSGKAVSAAEKFFGSRQSGKKNVGWVSLFGPQEFDSDCFC